MVPRKDIEMAISPVLDSHAIGLCPSCSTTWVKALTKGPVLFEDKGSLPSQSMQPLHLAFFSIMCYSRGGDMPSPSLSKVLLTTAHFSTN